MRIDISHLFAALLVMLTTSSGALSNNMQGGITVYVESGPRAVIAFLPPLMQNMKASGAATAQANVNSAIESTKRCLGKDDISYQIVFADRIVVRSPGRDEAFNVGHFAPLVGALLLRENTNARILFAGGGPEALRQVLQSAASEYFERKCRAER